MKMTEGNRAILIVVFIMVAFNTASGWGRILTSVL